MKYQSRVASTRTLHIVVGSMIVALSSAPATGNGPPPKQGPWFPYPIALPDDCVSQDSHGAVTSSAIAVGSTPNADYVVCGNSGTDKNIYVTPTNALYATGVWTKAGGVNNAAIDISVTLNGAGGDTVSTLTSTGNIYYTLIDFSKWGKSWGSFTQYPSSQDVSIHPAQSISSYESGIVAVNSNYFACDAWQECQVVDYSSSWTAEDPSRLFINAAVSNGHDDVWGIRASAFGNHLEENQHVPLGSGSWTSVSGSALDIAIE